MKCVFLCGKHLTSKLEICLLEGVVINAKLFFLLNSLFFVVCSSALAESASTEEVVVVDPTLDGGELVDSYEVPDFADPDPKVNEVASKLRRLAIVDSEIHLKDLQSAVDHARSSDDEGLHRFARSNLERYEQALSQGKHLYRAALDLGSVRLLRIEGSYICDVRLNKRNFPQASEVIFILYDLDFVDRSRVNRVLEEWNRSALGDDAPTSKLVHEYAVAARTPLDEAPIELLQSNATARRFASRFRLESNVQFAQVGPDSRWISALYKNKPKFFSAESVSLFFKKSLEGSNKKLLRLALVAGSVQGVATYWIVSSTISQMQRDGTARPLWTDPEAVPYIAMAWSVVYGMALGCSPTYSNIVYDGKIYSRLAKLAIFSVLFAVPYKMITDPTSLLSFAGLQLLVTNIALNQYGKDLIYAVPRLRERLGWLSRERATTELQAWYHSLWLGKMLHFTNPNFTDVHLMSFVAGAGMVAGVYHLLCRHWQHKRTLQFSSALESQLLHTIDKQLRDFWRSVTLGVLGKKKSLPDRLRTLFSLKPNRPLKGWTNRGSKSCKGQFEEFNFPQAVE